MKIKSKIKFIVLGIPSIILVILGCIFGILEGICIFISDKLY